MVLRLFVGLALLAALVRMPLTGAAQKKEAASIKDPVLEAMAAELDRSRQLQVMGVDAPYFIEYSMFDGHSLALTASLGALVHSHSNRFRLPQVQVRVGTYALDNTNFASSGMRGGERRVSGFPLDNDPLVMRHMLWLATDEAYKQSAAQMARKRAALKSMTQSDQFADFHPAEPNVLLLDPRHQTLDEKAWVETIRRLSAVFSQAPELAQSAVDFYANQSTFYLANSEGSRIRSPESTMYVRLFAQGQAPDGMELRDSVSFYARDFGRMADAESMRRAAAELGASLQALLRAPAGDSYVGPVLFEGEAAAQLMAQLLGRNLALRRRPLSEPGRPVPFQASELEGRFGSRILPEWISVEDNPTISEWEGRPLIGAYVVDLEGISPKPLTVVENGVLKNPLLTRQPIKGFPASNGHGRLPGPLGANAAAFSNLMVSASQTEPLADLKKKLIELAQQRQKPYAIVVRKLDFPSPGSFDEVREILTRAAQSGGGLTATSLPLLVYRLYPDGREELVRGMQFRGLGVRALRDIVGASAERVAFHYLENNMPFALWNAASVVAECSVVTPSLLLEEVELEKREGQWPHLPLVPAPDLSPSL